jgi:hypothetical protein
MGLGGVPFASSTHRSNGKQSNELGRGQQIPFISSTTASQRRGHDGGAMDKKTSLKYINCIIAVLILNQALTGIFHKSLSYGVFEIVHQGGGILLFIGVILHVALNWGWVKTTFFKKK